MSILAKYLAGKEARRQQDEVDRQGAFRQYLGQNAQAIMSGDTQALQGAYGIDPMAAMQLQGQMDQRRAQAAAAQRAERGLGLEEERHDLALKQYRAQLSKEEAQAQAEQVRQTVQKALAAPDEATFDALMAQDPNTEQFVGQFENRERIAQSFLSIADQLEMMDDDEPDYERVGNQFVDMKNPQAGAGDIPGLRGEDEGFRMATPEEAEKYGAQAGQFGPDGRFYPINPPSGTSLTTGPDGTVQFAQGPGVSNKPLTEAQSKDNVYATRARGALEQLDRAGSEALTSRRDRVLEAVPMGVGREAQSQEFQVAKQAGDEFLQAILRKDTGAAITEPEQELYGVTYLPQPGDGPAVLAAKRESRARAVAALESGMSEQQIEQITRTEKALIESVQKTNAEIGPRPGDVEDGFRFKGGDPADPANWERAD